MTDFYLVSSGIRSSNLSVTGATLTTRLPAAKYADSVSEFMSKCIGDVVPTVTIKTYPNQKPWMDATFEQK